MGSQNSNIDSKDNPVDHDGNSLEYEMYTVTGVPFDVSNSVFKEISREESDKQSGLPSSSGGIPVEKETVEVTSEDEGLIFEDDRQRMMEMQAFMVVNGLSVADFEHQRVIKTDKFNLGLPNLEKIITSRDEFGLSIFGLGFNSDLSGLKSSKTKGIEEESAGQSKKEFKSWANVIKEDPPYFREVKFDYCHLPNGADVVEPPDEILQKGLDKFKCCIEGRFTRGFLPFHKVQAALFGGGGGMGLLEITEIPLWIKLSNIPDCYWIEEGLGRLVTLCRIKSKQLINPITRAKSIVDVVVAYQQKPKVCSGCKSLGHRVSACPTTFRKWVRKEVQPNISTSVPTPTPVVPSEDININKTEVPDTNQVQDEGEWTNVTSKRSRLSTGRADVNCEPSPDSLMGSPNGDTYFEIPAPGDGFF
ncbi:hypothetical protein POM88_035710 [Heracleum sosnowskyi]|uniref:DUF4283 domain-containing protein n=1 Tax=Heracleum sosnowskyi TaxID=360622 RepID=A0AAD8MEY5_9APIA|nr:hypothetical protein POM88_035710 [Heracleum sosnowskyi]